MWLMVKKEINSQSLKRGDRTHTLIHTLQTHTQTAEPNDEFDYEMNTIQNKIKHFPKFKNRLHLQPQEQQNLEIVSPSKLNHFQKCKHEIYVIFQDEFNHVS